jgi:polysaccharide biosynthesis transport protein
VVSSGDGGRVSDFYPAAADRGGGGVRYVRAVRQHLWLVVGVVAVSLVAAFLLVASAQKRFTASADVGISPLSATDGTFQGFDLFRQALDGSSPVVTAARVFDSPVIRGPAFRAMGADSRGASVAIAPLSQSDILTVTANAPRAGQAARVANTFASSAVAARSALFRSELSERIGVLRKEIAAIPVAERAGNFEYSALQQQLAVLAGFKGQGDPTVELVAPASVPAGPSWPRPTLTYAIALLASLLLGCGLAVLLEVFNPRIGREDELLLEQRLPILARVPRLPVRTVRGYLTGRRQLPASAWKGYRTLRAVLATAGPDGGFPRSVLVTSASPGDGKTMTAANLAITLAAAEMRVVLVDGDLHRPMVAAMFNRMPRGRGLAGVLSGRESLEVSLVESPAHPRLSLLLAHREHGAQSLLMDSGRIRGLLDELRAVADVVVIDSPPLPEVAEALEMATVVDAVVVCVRLGNTRRDKLNQLREMLARRDISPVGFVVTTRKAAESEDSYEYGYSDEITPAGLIATGEGRKHRAGRLWGA